ncbi:MAG TPA: hypothetical protein VHE35_29540 [Kofleriaceae bacterium]|nr:hypothetical protein [Kofleriaceae bacterium]
MSDLRFAALLLVTGVAGACGRIGYDPQPSAGDDAAADAAADAPSDVPGDAPPAPIHIYHLNDLSDDLGGPDLISKGGDFVAGGYQFDDDHGLGLIDGLPDHVYTIDLVYTPTMPLGEWHKLLDFQGRSTDEGLYTHYDSLVYVKVSGTDITPSVITGMKSGHQYQITMSRAADGTVTGMVDGAQAFQFQDTTEVAALPGPDAPLEIFMDDDVTGGGETSYGIVRRIVIFDQVLTAPP